MTGSPRHRRVDFDHFFVQTEDGSSFGHLRVYEEGPCWMKAFGKTWYRVSWTEFRDWITQHGRTGDPNAITKRPSGGAS